MGAVPGLRLCGVFIGACLLTLFLLVSGADSLLYAGARGTGGSSVCRGGAGLFMWDHLFMQGVLWGSHGPYGPQTGPALLTEPWPGPLASGHLDTFLRAETQARPCNICLSDPQTSGVPVLGLHFLACDRRALSPFLVIERGPRCARARGHLHGSGCPCGPASVCDDSVARVSQGVCVEGKPG